MSDRDFIAFAGIDDESLFVESIREGKGNTPPKGDVAILANSNWHGMRITYVYDARGYLVGQQWIINVERDGRRWDEHGNVMLDVDDE